jgi:outer membrane immunogenic protein
MRTLLLTTVALLGLTAGAGAADLPGRTVDFPVVAAVPVFTWTGFYVGVNAGYGWNTNSDDRYFDPTLGVYVGGDDNNGGFVGGGQIGYNYQIGSFVIGVETDIQYADIGGRSNYGYVNGLYYGDDSNGNWFGTVRARAGVAFDRALIYVTGGLAYGDVARGSSVILGPTGAVIGYGSNSDVNTGWTLGGGVEYAFTNNLTAKVEGLYVNLDTKNDAFGYYGDRDNAEFGVVRAGLNFKFGTY